MNRIKLWLAGLLAVETRVTRSVFVIDPLMVARIAKAMPTPSPDHAEFGQGIQYVLHALRTQAFHD